MKLDFYSDAGHGWLKVKIQELEKLGLAEKISNSSYMKNENAYLEEDFDTSQFCNEMRKTNSNYNFNEHVREHTSNFSTIRNYESYNYQKYLKIKSLAKRFNEDLKFREYALRVIITESKSNNVSVENLMLKSFEDQSNNARNWLKHLADTLEIKIKEFIQYRITLY